MRFQTPSLPTTAVLVACGIVLAAAGLTAISGGDMPRVQVTVSVPADGRFPSGEVVSLLVTLSVSASVLDPRFFIVTGPTVFAWNAEGPQPFDGPGTITYRLTAPCRDCPIPSGAFFFVRVYDIVSRSYSFSTTVRA